MIKMTSFNGDFRRAEFIGLSTDTKGMTWGAGSTFYETDTQNAYIYMMVQVGY